MEAEINKSKELRATLKLINDKLHFEGLVEENDPIAIDYTPPLGDNLGYTSLELLLLSLSSCLGSALLVFLRKMNKNIIGLTINTHGIRKEDHPTCFKTIILKVKLYSNNTNPEDFNKVLKMAEDTYCPVWAMIKGNVDIIVKPDIINQ